MAAVYEARLPAISGWLSQFVKNGQGRLAALTELVGAQAHAVRDKAVESVNFVTSTASSCVKQTRQKATGVRSIVVLRTSSALIFLHDVRASVSRRVGSVRTLARRQVEAGKHIVVNEYSKLRRRGLKAWSLETGKSAKNLAVEVATYIRSSSSEAYSKALATSVRAVDSSKAAAMSGVKNALRRVDSMVTTATAKSAELGHTAVQRATSAVALTKGKAVELGSATREVVKDGKFQATVAGAAGGAATLGAGGAASGLAVGSALGTVAGLVPAIFTLGLSVPVGAAIGGGAGFVTGAVVGSTSGAMSGGAAGYCVFKERKQIHGGTKKTLQKVGSGAEFVKERAVASAGFVKDKAMELRSRVSRSGVGGA